MALLEFHFLPHNLKDQLLNTFSFVRFIGLNIYLRKKFKSYHLRTSGGAEIDLILERTGEDPIIIEIKSSTEVQPRHLKHLKSLHRDYPSIRKICLCQESIARYSEGIEILPWERGLKRAFLENL